MSNLNWLVEPVILSTKVLFFDLWLFLFIGIFCAYFLAYSKSKFKCILELLVTLPLIFPPMATGFLLLYILGKNGFFGKFFNEIGVSFVFDIKGLILAGFVSGLPLMVKPLQSVFETFPKSLIEAGEIYGKNKFQIAFFIIFPNCARTIIATLVIAGARAVGEVGISLMLGGNIIGKTDTISLAIYNAVYDGQNDRALILSTILIALSTGLFFLISKFTDKNSKRI